MSIKYDDKIVVTGGTGFLGSHILRDLILQGYTNVFALKRVASRMDLVSDIENKISWVDGDILDIKSLEELIDDTKGVIHSAAKVSYNPRDRRDVLKMNVEGTANVVNVCLSRKVEKLIFLSSVAAIGRSVNRTIVDEKVEWVVGDTTTNYGLAKHLAEMEVWRGMHEGLDVGILNPSMILGPSFWGTSSTKLFTYVARQGRLYPPGSNGFVDVRDVAMLSSKFLTSTVKNERIIAVSEMSKYKDLLAKIAGHLGKKPASRSLGRLSASLAWRLSYFTSNPSITKETVRITSSDFCYDNSKSKDIFGIKYRSIQESVRDTCDIYSKNISSGQDFGFFPVIRP